MCRHTENFMANTAYSLPTHILCVGSNEPPQNLLFENTSAPTLTNIQLTKFQKYGQTYPHI